MKKLSINLSNTQISIENSSYMSTDECITSFIKNIKKEKKISIINWTPKNKNYPAYILLSGDKGILGYIDFCAINLSNNDLLDSISRDSITLLNQIKIADSQLDRPIFFVYLIKITNREIVLFETNEQIKDRWLTNGLNSKIYHPIIEEMGNLDNLISIWTSLKQNTLRKKR